MDDEAGCLNVRCMALKTSFTTGATQQILTMKAFLMCVLFFLFCQIP